MPPHLALSMLLLYYKNNIYLEKTPERHLENEIILPGASTFYILVYVLLDFNFPLKIVMRTPTSLYIPERLACNPCITMNPQDKQVTH